MSNPDERELSERDETREADSEETDALEAQEGGVSELAEEQRDRLQLEVAVETKSPCERHITVKVSPEDVNRYFQQEIGDLMPTAQVPGFRPGRAPRKLVERRFRKEVADRVKMALVMDAMTQINEDEKLTPISEPELDIEAVLLPEEGPFTFEFDLEVRPEFPLPKWKGLVIQKPVREFTREDVNLALARLLGQQGTLVPHSGPAQKDDYLVCDITAEADGHILSRHKEQIFRLGRDLSFQDAQIEGVDEVLVGVQAGDRRYTEALVAQNAPNPKFRGQKITVIFDVLEVKRLELPEVTEALVQRMGFETEGELRDAILDSLHQRLEYHQRQLAREQIANLLTESADWELPEKLLHRQSRRELERMILELQRSGFTEEQIRAQVNQLRQQSHKITAQRLREHFILERIAEEEKIEATEEDYQKEITLIALHSGENPRRVRARFEKEGLMDILRNQVIENKVISLILSHAEFIEVPYEPPREEVYGLDIALTGEGEKEPEVATGESSATSGS